MDDCARYAWPLAVAAISINIIYVAMDASNNAHLPLKKDGYEMIPAVTAVTSTGGAWPHTAGIVEAST